MARKTWNEVKNFCVVCTEPIDKQRVSRGAVTCTKECAKVRRDQQRALTDMKECRYCRRPSTPEEREAFKRFRQLEKRRPDLLYPETPKP